MSVAAIVAIMLKPSENKNRQNPREHFLFMPPPPKDNIPQPV